MYVIYFKPNRIKKVLSVSQFEITDDTLIYTIGRIAVEGSTHNPVRYKADLSSVLKIVSLTGHIVWPITL